MVDYSCRRPSRPLLDVDHSYTLASFRLMWSCYQWARQAAPAIWCCHEDGVAVRAHIPLLLGAKQLCDRAANFGSLTRVSLPSLWCSSDSPEKLAKTCLNTTRSRFTGTHITSPCTKDGDSTPILSPLIGSTLPFLNMHLHLLLTTRTSTLNMWASRVSFQSKEVFSLTEISRAELGMLEGVFGKGKPWEGSQTSREKGWKALLRRFGMMRQDISAHSFLESERVRVSF